MQFSEYYLANPIEWSYSGVSVYFIQDHFEENGNKYSSRMSATNNLIRVVDSDLVESQNIPHSEQFINSSVKICNLTIRVHRTFCDTTCSHPQAIEKVCTSDVLEVEFLVYKPQGAQVWAIGFAIYSPREFTDNIGHYYAEDEVG